MRGRRLAGAYRWFAATLLTSLLGFAAANGLAALLLRAGVGTPEPGPLRAGLESLRASYPELADEEIRELLREFWTRPYVYEPYTQFREGAHAGRFLNLRPEGFRAAGHDQAWPPDSERYNVFVFGGSTAMGYGVADAETLPARLEGLLATAPCVPVTVYNFARSSYFSSQERVLFEQLVLAGFVPDLAVFVDGLNEFLHPDGHPRFTERLTYLMTETESQLAWRWLVQLPLARLLKGLRGETDRARFAAVEDVAAILERWFRNKRLIEAVAGELGTATLFVWQPVPFRETPAGRQAPGAANGEPPEGLTLGYARVDALRRAGDPRLAAPSFLWLADAPPPGADPLYVDRVHYSAAFTRQLASRLAPVVSELLCRAGD